MADNKELGIAPMIDRLLGHWLLAAAMILVAAALTIPQLDRYPLSLDALFSYSFAHGLTENQYTPLAMLENLASHDSNQAPLHYLLLHFWGYVAGHSLAASRLILLFAGFLALALVYRLTRDFVSPVAGVLAAFVLLCSAFYAFYYAQVRYYTLIVLLAALIVWLYLRIVTRWQHPKRRDYLTLLLACNALILTHFFGFALYATLSLYHLLAVKKDRRWLAIVATALIALLLAAPWLSVMLTAGVERANQHHADNASNIGSILATWILVISNGSPLLLGVSLAGVVVGWRRGLLRGNPFLLLFPLLALSIALLSEVTGVVSTGQMRYFLVGTPIVVGFVAAGLFALYRLRRWLGILALLWLVAGLAFMRAADWDLFIGGRTWSYAHPPWHLISRWMQVSGEALPTMNVNGSHKILNRRAFAAGNLKIYYFEQHGISLYRSLHYRIEDFLQSRLHNMPSFRVIYQTSQPYHSDLAAIEAATERFAYLYSPIVRRVGFS